MATRTSTASSASYAQLASLDVATPPLPEGHLGPTERREAVRLAGEAVADAPCRGDCARGRRALGALGARPALGQAGLLSAGLGDPFRAREPGILHSPHRSGVTPTCCAPGLVGALGSTCPPRATGARAVRRVEKLDAERAAVDLERNGRSDLRGALLEQELERVSGPGPSTPRCTGLIGSGVFVRFGRGVRGFLPVRGPGGEAHARRRGGRSDRPERDGRRAPRRARRGPGRQHRSTSRPGPPRARRARRLGAGPNAIVPTVVWRGGRARLSVPWLREIRKRRRARATSGFATSPRTAVRASNTRSSTPSMPARADRDRGQRAA